MLSMNYGEYLDPMTRAEFESLVDTFNALWLTEHDEEGEHLVSDPTTNVAAADLAYVTVGNTSGLSAERALVGTSNEIDVTDNGANSTVAIGLVASPTVTGLTVSGLTSGRVVVAGASGVLSDDADLTFATDTLTTTKVSIGVGSPSAALHIKAGSATANTGPLKFTSGTKLTTAEAGAYEYNGNHLVSNATLRFPLGGVLFDSYADVSVGGAEADIYSYTLAANTFNGNGDKVLASFSGNFVTVGTETVDIKVYFAGTLIWDSAGVVPASGTNSWRVGVELIRVSSTIVRYSVFLTTTGGTTFTYAAVGELTGLTLSGTNILKITGLSSGVGSGSGDIVGKMAYAEFKPAA